MTAIILILAAILIAKAAHWIWLAGKPRIDDPMAQPFVDCSHWRQSNCEDDWTI